MWRRSRSGRCSLEAPLAAQLLSWLPTLFSVFKGFLFRRLSSSGSMMPPLVSVMLGLMLQFSLLRFLVQLRFLEGQA